MNREDYSKMTDKEISDLLLDIGEENWHLDEDLIEESISRWLKMFGFANCEVEE